MKRACIIIKYISIIVDIYIYIYAYAPFLIVEVDVGLPQVHTSKTVEIMGDVPNLGTRLLTSTSLGQNDLISPRSEWQNAAQMWTKLKIWGVPCAFT